MTPQLMQAIKLLQLSNLDLAAYVEGELEKNPLLERAAEGEPGVIDGAAEPVAAGVQRRQRCARGNRGRRRPHRRKPGNQPQRDRGAARHRSRKRIPRRCAASPRPRAGADAPAAPSDWSSVGSGGREDGDYNLEAFVSAAPTLADHLAEQLSLAIADPVRRMIGQYLIDMVDEAGYLTGDLPSVAEKLGAPLAEVEAVLAHRAGLRSAGRMRAQSHRMPGDPAQGARPLRSRDGGAGRPPRSARQARSRGAAAHLRRRRRGSRRDDRGDPQPQSEARPRLRLRPWCSRSCPTSTCAPAPTAASSSS